MLKLIKNYPNYLVSHTGKVWSKNRRKFLKLHTTGMYPSVVLCKDGNTKEFRIHRLVLEAFIGSRPVGMGCRHLDGDRTNNKLSNLKWGTQKENMADMFQHGTDNYLKGEQRVGAKLTDPKVVLMRLLYTNKWLQFRQWELAELFGVSAFTVSCIVRWKKWKHIL
jgi:hypothetical protein